jgi:hypothetical protein
MELSTVDRTIIIIDLPQELKRSTAWIEWAKNKKNGVDGSKVDEKVNQLWLLIRDLKTQLYTPEVLEFIKEPIGPFYLERASRLARNESIDPLQIQLSGTGDPTKLINWLTSKEFKFKVQQNKI